MDIQKKSWSDVTLKQFLEIRDIIEVQDAYTTCNLIDLLYGTDSANMPITEYKKYVSAIDFLKEDIKVLDTLPDTVVLNNTVYRTSANLTEVKTAQYIDFQNYCKQEKPKYEDILSVFIIPKDYEYNSGYDLRKVKEDILQMPIDLVMTLSFFFSVQFQAFIEIFPVYFREELKAMKMPQEKKDLIMKELDKLDWQHLELFPILQEYVGSSMRPGKV